MPGWGVGELWTPTAAVLAHEFDFGAEHSSRRALEGAASPPTGTVSGQRARAAHGSVPTSRLERGGRQPRSRRASSPGLPRTSRAPTSASTRFRSTSRTGRRSSTRWPPHCARSPAGRWSATRSSPRSPGTRARSERSAPLRGNRFAFLCPVPSRRRCRRHRRLWERGGRGQAPAARARGCHGARGVISSEDVREELAQIAPTRRCDRLAELSALFHAAGSLHLRGKGEWAIHRPRERCGSTPRVRAPTRRGAPLRDPDVPAARVRPGTRYQLHLDGDDRALDVLVAAGILDGRHAPLERPPRRVVARACCRSAYVRGAFLGGGTLSTGAPRTWSCGRRRATPPSCSRRSQRKPGSAYLAERSSHHAAYAKAWDEVESVLALTGAAEAVLALEERVVLAATREQANRLANADHANLVRTSRAARAQLEAVEASCAPSDGSKISRSSSVRRPSSARATRRSHSEPALRTDPRRARPRCSGGSAGSRSSHAAERRRFVPSRTIEILRPTWARAPVAADPDPICRESGARQLGEGIVLGASPPAHYAPWLASSGPG